MRHPGEVIFVYRNESMIVVHHDGGYAVVELLAEEGSVEVRDRVSGDRMDWAVTFSTPSRVN